MFGMKTLFVISDIHGHYYEMIDALDNAGFDEDNEKHLLIVCGDLFDRGEYSLEVYRYLKRLTDKKQAVVIRGNHDTMFIEYLKGSDNPFHYMHNGTDKTFASFLERTQPFESWCLLDKGYDMLGITQSAFTEWIGLVDKYMSETYSDLLDWLESLPYYYETDNHIFTHGAIDGTCENWKRPKIPIKFGYNKWNALTWNDGSFFDTTNEFGQINNTNKIVVIGHFGTKRLRELFNYPLEGNISDYDILERHDGKVIAIDSTVVCSKKINVLMLQESRTEKYIYIPPEYTGDVREKFKGVIGYEYQK